MVGTMNYSGIALKTGTDYSQYVGTLGENYVNIADDVADAYHIWDSGKLPFIHVMFHPSRQPDATISRIAFGAYDHLIENWFMELLSYCATGRKAVIVYLPEMNGNWTVYGQEEPVRTLDFIAAYRYFVGKGRMMGLDSSMVQWCWAPNDKGWLSLSDWYPGDEWVDIVGMSAYQWGGIFHDGWSTPAQLLDPTVSEVREFTNKPLLITQIGSGLNDSRSPKWLDQLVTYANTDAIDGFIWFNIDVFGLGEGMDWNTQAVGLDPVRPDYWFFDC